MNRELSDLTFPNVSYLRTECLKRAKSHPSEYLTTSEKQSIIDHVVKHTEIAIKLNGKNSTPDEHKSLVESLRNDAVLHRIDEDFLLASTPMPKWPGLAAWLTHDSIVTKRPLLVCDIVKSFLN